MEVSVQTARIKAAASAEVRAGAGDSRASKLGWSTHVHTCESRAETTAAVAASSEAGARTTGDGGAKAGSRITDLWAPGEASTASVEAGASCWSTDSGAVNSVATGTTDVGAGHTVLWRSSEVGAAHVVGFRSLDARARHAPLDSVGCGGKYCKCYSEFHLYFLCFLDCKLTTI